MIVNSGIANTCCADGAEKAEGMCEIAADYLGIPVGDMLVASTGRHRRAAAAGAGAGRVPLPRDRP